MHISVTPNDERLGAFDCVVNGYLFQVRKCEGQIQDNDVWSVLWQGHDKAWQCVCISLSLLGWISRFIGVTKLPYQKLDTAGKIRKSMIQ